MKLSTSIADRSSPLSYPLSQIAVSLVDYTWVISVYIVTAFSLSVFLDGYLLPPFDINVESQDTSLYLGIKVILQLALQGFIAIFLCALLQNIPSPVHHVGGYDAGSSLGLLVRNPAIISVLLFGLSKSLQARLKYLFSRYDHHRDSLVERHTGLRV